MKKIMIAAAIVCAAVFAQAAFVSWKVTGAVGGEGTQLKYSTAYDFTVAIYTASGTLVGSSTDSTASGFAQYDGTVDGVSADTSYYAVLSASSKDYELTDTVASTKYYFTTDLATTYSINLTNGNGITNPSTGHGSWSKGDWQAVPEPTSGLLLLLGVAGLALRRKQK